MRKMQGKNRKNRCRFCTKEGRSRPAFVDYKDVTNLEEAGHGPGQALQLQAERALCRVPVLRGQRRRASARFMGLLPRLASNFDHGCVGHRRTPATPPVFSVCTSAARGCFL